MITGLVTGSDHKAEVVLNLQMCGMMGEGQMGEDNVWITKTHHPLDNEFVNPFRTNKMFVLMRNPLDIIPSHCNLINLGSHSMVPKEQYNLDLPLYW